VAGGCGYGYISQEPDFALTYSTSGGSGLYFYVEGEGDTTLLIRTPSGEWLCNDDGHGNADPIVDIPNAAQGKYQVWAGAYNSGYIQATLYVSERYPAEAASPTPAPDPPIAEEIQRPGSIFDVFRENPPTGVSETCPVGLRTVQDPLSEAPNLACTDLNHLYLYEVNLAGANLEGANLSYTYLGRADLTGVNLEEADLEEADLAFAHLNNANLSGANLNGTDLRGANLSGADLSDANLRGADLLGAILTGATYNSATQFPPNMDPAAWGAILSE